MSAPIQNISSAPAYITSFIQTNMTKIQEIYEEGITEHSSGCMRFDCSQEHNKMDVMFMNDESMSKIITKESWESLKQGMPQDKKLFFVQDIDRKAVFLIYV